MWLKKLSVIARENGKELVTLKLEGPEGSDLRASSGFYDISPANSKPSDSEIDKHFFLPVLDCYDDGLLNIFGSSGYY